MTAVGELELPALDHLDRTLRGERFREETRRDVLRVHGADHRLDVLPVRWATG